MNKSVLMTTTPIKFFIGSNADIERLGYLDTESILFQPSAPRSYVEYNERHQIFGNYFDKMYSVRTRFNLSMLWVAGYRDRELNGNFHWNNEVMWEYRQLEFFPGTFEAWSSGVHRDDIHKTYCLVLCMSTTQYKEVAPSIERAGYTVDNMQVNQKRKKIIFIPFGQLVRADFQRITLKTVALQKV